LTGFLGLTAEAMPQAMRSRRIRTAEFSKTSAAAGA
jgi:hypothetical protein